MTKLEIRKKFVSQTGRYALVTDFAGADYTDNGADFHVDEAMSFLNDKLPTPSLSREFVTTLHPAQQVVYFPDAMSVERLVLVDSDGVERTMERQDCFDRAKNRETTGKPCQYWVDGFDGYLPFTAEVLTESTLAIGNDTLFDGQRTPGWGLAATGTAITTLDEVGKLSLYVPDSSTGIGTWKIAYGDPGEDTPYTVGFRKITVEFTLYYTAGTPAPNFVLRVIGNDNLEPNQQQDLSALSNGRYSYTFDAVSSNGFIYISFRMITGSGGTLSNADISNVRVYTHCTERFTVWPVPDASYDLHAHGRFLNKRLIAENDSNWWTLEYPHLVIRAAKMSLEGQLHRNETGEDAHYKALLRDIHSIYMNRFVTPKYHGQTLSRPG